MTKNKLMMACAGAGKTEFIVKQALNVKSDEKVLITTYTNNNEDEIKNRIISEKGYIPANITIQSWWSFLLQHGVKPYQSYVLDKNIDIKGLVLAKGASEIIIGDDGKPILNSAGHPIKRKKDDNPNIYYLSSCNKIYSDKIASFVCDTNNYRDNKGCIINRLQNIYDNIIY